jgi:hypothetical protein
MNRLSVTRLATPFALALAAIAIPGCTTASSPATQPASVSQTGQKTVAGRWVAQFDTQLGIQTYTFDFKLAGTTLSGTAVGQTADQPARDPIVLTECTLTGNAIHFVETRDNNGTALRIEYTGTVTGDTMPLKRAVGDIATTESTAKRAPM